MRRRAARSARPDWVWPQPDGVHVPQRTPAAAARAIHSCQVLRWLVRDQQLELSSNHWLSCGHSSAVRGWQRASRRCRCARRPRPACMAECAAPTASAPRPSLIARRSTTVPVTHPIRCATGQCAAVPGSGRLDQPVVDCPHFLLPRYSHVRQSAWLPLRRWHVRVVPVSVSPVASLPVLVSAVLLVHADVHLSLGDVCPQANATTCPLSSPCPVQQRSLREVDSAVHVTVPAQPARLVVLVYAVPQVQCFDGSCASSPLTCYQRAYEANQATAAAVTSFDVNKDVFNQSCGSVDQFPCANGLCLWSQDCQHSAAMSRLSLRVPAAYPLRCPDGSCIVAGSVPARAVRLLRASRVCAVTTAAAGRAPISAWRATAARRPRRCSAQALPPHAWLPSLTVRAIRSSPYRPPCLGRSARRLLQTTVADEQAVRCALRTATATAPQWPSRWPWQWWATPTIDVSVDSANVVRTQIIIPAGALPVNVSSFDVAPVAESALRSTATPFAATVLSTPFSCNTSDDNAFLLNLTVNAAVDLQLPSSSAVSASSVNTSADSSVTTPCAITTSATSFYSVAAYTANGENSTCTGTLRAQHSRHGTRLELQLLLQQRTPWYADRHPGGHY